MAKTKKYDLIQIMRPMDIEDLNKKNQAKHIIQSIVNKANTILTNYLVTKKQFNQPKAILIKIYNCVLYLTNQNKLRMTTQRIKKKDIQHITLS